MLEALARKSTPYQQSEIFGIYVLVFEIHAENFQLCSRDIKSQPFLLPDSGLSAYRWHSSVHLFPLF